MTTPRSQQYIRVKKCPEPDPDIICPVDGWVKPENPWTPPIIPPTPNNEELILLCDRSGDDAIACYTVRGGTGQVRYELYNAETNALLITTDLNSAAKYEMYFSGYPDVLFFYIRIKPIVSGATITRFYTTTITGFSKDWPIIYADFTKAPNLTTFAEAFLYISKLKRIDFPNILPECTSMSAALRGTGLLWLFLPQLPKATTFANMCNNCQELTQIYLPDDLPECTSMASMCTDCNKLLEFRFPKTIKKCSNIGYMLQRASNVKLLHLWEEAPLLVTVLSAFQDMYQLESRVIIKDTGVISSMTNLLYNAFKLPYLKFDIEESVASSLQYITRDANELQYLELPRKMPNLNALTGFCTSPKLYKLIMPDEVNYNGMINTSTGLPALPLLKKIEGNMACGANTYWNFTTTTVLNGLKEFNKPLAKFDMLCIGTQSGGVGLGAIEYVDVDWVNSPWRASTVSIRLYGKLQATEINRIFSSLPSIGYSSTIDVRYNPGSAGCDPTIATAKGWTVQR